MLILLRWYRFIDRNGHDANEAWFDLAMLFEMWQCFRVWLPLRKRCTFEEFTLGRCPLMYDRWTQLYAYSVR